MSVVVTPIVIAVSSRALFNLEKEHELFETQGVKAFRDHQIRNKDVPLEPGVAFSFIRRILSLNQHIPEGLNPFQVVVLSRNSPETGQRFFSSCRYYDLPIHAGAFTSGYPTFPYLKAFNVALFLSADKDTVMQAIQHGQPAGLVLSGNLQQESYDTDDNELRIAFDFDGVIIDDEAEIKFYQGGLNDFEEHEVLNRTTPHAPGPLHDLFFKLAQFQKIEQDLCKKNPNYRPALHISIVTARGAPAEQRLITTLNSLGMNAAELFLLGGRPKDHILKTLKPHIFFDDQFKHLEKTSSHVPSVLIPFGIHNFQTRQ